MCGIAGRFNYDPHHHVDRSLLMAMTDAVAHRGPDAAGYFVDGAIGLGHRRLSIIDLSTGHQRSGTFRDVLYILYALVSELEQCDVRRLPLSSPRATAIPSCSGRPR